MMLKLSVRNNIVLFYSKTSAIWNSQKTVFQVVENVLISGLKLVPPLFTRFVLPYAPWLLLVQFSYVSDTKCKLTFLNALKEPILSDRDLT